MGLPEDYVLPATLKDAYQLTGNGVVVPVVSWLERNLLSRLLAKGELAAA